MLEMASEPSDNIVLRRFESRFFRAQILISMHLGRPIIFNNSSNFQIQR